MNQTAAAYEQLLGRFVAWAKARPDVGAAFIVGSRARTERPADEWSDLDILLVVDRPEPYVSDADWLEDLGRPWMSFVEKSGAGEEMERRVMFEPGLDVDFVLLTRRKARRLAGLLRLRKRCPPLFQLLPKKTAQGAERAAGVFYDVARRGVRVLLDKDGIGDLLLPGAAEASVPPPPEQGEFLNLINDFWYHAVWSAKRLRRGELWTAKGCSDSYMKRLLLNMLEWHARSENGRANDTWHNGRFLEQWADGRAVQELRSTFAHYDEDDLWRALVATIDLFRRLAGETAARLGYPYPAYADRHATELVRGLFSDG